MENKLKATEEQIAYAKLLDIGMKIGLLIIIVTFIIYLTGILEPYVLVNNLPLYWKMPVKEYLEATGIPHGWAWLGMVNKGDFLNFIPIAFLAGVTILCYIRIMPILFRNKDTAYGILALLEVLVLVLAASGVLKSGGH
ncbi:MAG: hypothetical protein AB1632_08970 [Nitrospirota bacterium]